MDPKRNSFTGNRDCAAPEDKKASGAAQSRSRGIMKTLLMRLLARFRHAPQPGRCDICDIPVPANQTRCDACWWSLNAY